MQLGELVIRQRWPIIAAAFVFLLLTASGVRFLGTTSDNRVLFSEDNPHLTALEGVEDTCTKDENVFIVLEPRDGTVFTRETLVAVEELTGLADSLFPPVDSITNLQHSWADGDDLVVENLVQSGGRSAHKESDRIGVQP